MARSYGADDVICLDLWAQQEHGERFLAFETVTDDDLAGAVGRDAVARRHALATGQLDEWLDRVALVLDVYFDSIDRRPGTDCAQAVMVDHTSAATSGAAGRALRERVGEGCP